VTRKSKREIEREVSALTSGSDDTGDGIVIICEREDGTLTDPNGDPLPEGWREDAELVIDMPPEITDTWP